MRIRGKIKTALASKRCSWVARINVEAQGPGRCDESWTKPSSCLSAVFTPRLNPWSLLANPTFRHLQRACRCFELHPAAARDYNITPLCSNHPRILVALSDLPIWHFKPLRHNAGSLRCCTRQTHVVILFRRSRPMLCVFWRVGTPKR